MGAILRKYAVATAAGTHVGVPMPKAGSADFAVGADWTPAAGDVKVSIDGGAATNITTLPTAVGPIWIFQFSSGEMTGKSIRVYVVDAATKAVDDQFILIETYGNASALHPFDLGTATVAPAAGSIVAASFAAGAIDASAFAQAAADKVWATTTRAITGGTIGTYTGNTPQTGDAFARLGAPAGASTAADIAAVPTANAVADALLDRANGVETGLTPRGALRVISAALAGKLSGAAGTNVAIRNVGDTKDRVTATVDASGNRTAVTVDAT